MLPLPVSMSSAHTASLASRKAAVWSALWLREKKGIGERGTGEVVGVRGVGVGLDPRVVEDGVCMHGSVVRSRRSGFGSLGPLIPFLVKGSLSSFSASRVHPLLAVSTYSIGRQHTT